MRHTSAGGIRARTVLSNSRADVAAKPIPVTSDKIAVAAISIPDHLGKFPDPHLGNMAPEASCFGRFSGLSERKKV